MNCTHIISESTDANGVITYYVCGHPYDYKHPCGKCFCINGHADDEERSNLTYRATPPYYNKVVELKK